MPNQQQTPALHADSLVKSFGGHDVIRGMSLRLGAGELLGLIGPNGAGKTTMFNLLAGTLAPDAGTVRLGPADITRRAPQGRCALGLSRSFQIPRPFPRMSVLENVMTAAQNQAGEAVWNALLRPGLVARQERAHVTHARDLINFVSLSHLERKPASVLSGGQRKLLELARVLMSEPRVILLDEPAAGVNPAMLEVIIDRVAEINKTGIAVLLIEHNMEMITRLCPRVIVMAGGQLLAEGAPAEVTQRPDVVDSYLSGLPA